MQYAEPKKETRALAQKVPNVNLAYVKVLDVRPRGKMEDRAVLTINAKVSPAATMAKVSKLVERVHWFFLVL